MRNLMIFNIFFAITALSVLGCKEKEDVLAKEKEAILGVWVGLEYPESDTAFFFEGNKIKLTGRAGDGNLYKYSINNDKITISSDNVSTAHEYRFSDNYNSIYIGNLLITSGIMDDAGIEFKK